ncbi:class I SAM-dependent methyltransferase [bacterium]|nr:class I SAM-dependent methyltransferase [bacterium]
MPTDSCPICDAYGPTRRERGEQHYLHCRNCHLLWREGGASLDDTTLFYRGNNPTEAISTAKQSLYSWMLDEAEKRLGQPGRLLDVGCSRGDFLLAAKERGWEVTGLEPVPELVQWGRDQGLDIREGVLSDVDFGEETFDLITYWDVILLVEDPLAEMKRARSLLSEDAQLFMRLRQHKIVRLMDSAWRWGGRFLLKTNPAVYHPFNYEPRTLHLLAQRSGFEFEVAPSLLTAGDPYAVADNPTIVGRMKKAADRTSSLMYALSSKKLVISPSMVVWGRRPSLRT